MANVNVTINGIKVEVPSTATVLEAAKVAGVDIPRLCFLKGVNENSSCRLCVVEIEGIRTLKNSCTVKVTDGMVVRTNTERVNKAVKANLELIAGNHKFECWKCPREHNCELLRLLRKYNIPNTIGEDAVFSRKEQLLNISDTIVLDSSKCVLCGRCIAACDKFAGTGVLDFNFRGSKTYVGPALNYPIEKSGCIFCGKCIQACPVGAIKEKDDIQVAQGLVDNKEYYTVACIAPAVRTALAEEFGYKIGELNAENKAYAALKALGYRELNSEPMAPSLFGDSRLDALVSALGWKDDETPFASSFAMFASGRAYEQIRNSIGYTGLNVKIGASHGGLSVGEDGGSNGHGLTEMVSNALYILNQLFVDNCGRATAATMTVKFFILEIFSNIV